MNSISKFRRYLLYSLMISVGIVVLFLYVKPWEKEVWITTTPDAFVRPAIPLRAGERNDGRLVVSISPSIGPKSADEIYRAAKRGRIVHVTLVSKNSTDKFDITGISADGNLLIEVSSMSDVKRVTSLLKFGDHGGAGQ